MNKSEKESGTIKFWNSEKGFGFITPDNEGEDIFVHITSIEGGVKLKQDDRVEFNIGQGKRGDMAINVEKI